MMDYLHGDEYLEYLKRNCGVRGYDLDERSPVATRPDVDVILRYVRFLHVSPEDRLLEVGCGLGRILKELHDAYGVRPYGIDLSSKIIDAARLRVGPLSADLTVARAEQIPFADEFFDKVLCWGTFDLTEQAQALREMTRVTRVGGRLATTGKNDDYLDDDVDALRAEVASRQKGIPGQFSDFNAMIEVALTLGLRPVEERFFERRGDFMNDRFLPHQPSRFYEYFVLFEKIHATRPVQVPAISAPASKTFRRLAPEGQ